jgi:hypothetical protein
MVRSATVGSHVSERCCETQASTTSQSSLSPRTRPPPGAAWDDRVDPRVFRDDLREHLVESWRSEAWLFGAARMTRRIVGLAKTADIETLPEELRAGGARGVLQTARR